MIKLRIFNKGIKEVKYTHNGSVSGQLFLQLNVVMKLY